MKKLGTLYFKKVKGELKLTGGDVYNVYSATGIRPRRILELFKEQVVREHELLLKAIDESIKDFKKII